MDVRPRGRQVGGNLPKVLETTAHTLREMKRLEGVIRTKTADGRMQLWVIGANCDTAADTPNSYYRWTEAEHFRLALELIRQGRLRTDGLISHRVPATEALGVFNQLAERPQDHLGVVIQWE